MSASDTRFMKLALGLAMRGLGRVWPNPAVGCVIVNDGMIVGRGWTQPGGRPHAETQALDQAKTRSQNATAYVTLEPCAHVGQTQPCAQALIDAGISEVVIATQDPDPRVDGGGIEVLQAAGITVKMGAREQEARVLNQGFLARILLGRPSVTLKLANSFDGRIATEAGESKWITGPQARRAVHMMRARHDAVLVGGGTARVDDPSLTVRDLGMTHNPVRIVMSRKLDIPLSGQLAQSAKDVPLWICHGAGADAGLCKVWQDIGATLIEIPSTNARGIDMRSAMQAIGSAGITRVFCEGGGALAASLLNADCVDELVGFTAGLSLGAEGQPSLGAMGIDQLNRAPRFDLREVRPVGADVMHRWARRMP